MDRLPTKLPFSKKKLPKRVIISYALDYVIIVVLIIGFYTLDAVEPFHQPFSLRNFTLRYPYAEKERVPVPLLVFLAVVIPACIIVIFTLVIDGMFSHKKTPGSVGAKRFLGPYRFKDRLWEMNCGLLGLGLATAAAFTITGALKNAIGKPRPDLIARCIPQGVDLENPGWALVTHSICTQKDNRILKDGFRSFPSGHSSSSFAGLFYLSLYIAGKLHVMDNRGEVWKTFVVLIPTLGAALIAGSRIMDARHHPFDVLSGSLLGILVAWAAYRQYFPPLSEPFRKGRAFPIRTWGREPIPPAERERIEFGDAGKEPLRAPADIPTRSPDEEQAFVSGAAETPGGNVFRKQISESQRRRQAEYGGGRDPQPSSGFDTRNPFASGSAPAGRRRHEEDYWSSSSEDRDGFELQPSYTLTDPRNQPSVENFAPVHQDTSYHPPAPTQLQSAQQPRVNVKSPSGVDSPKKPERDASTERRGVQLTESYA